MAPQARDPMDLPERLRRIWIVAKGELGRAGASFNPKTLIALAFLGLLMAGLSSVVQDRGFDFDHDLYRIAIDDQSPVFPAVSAAPVFQVVSRDPGNDHNAWLTSGDADIVVIGLNIWSTNTDKGNAAVGALTQAVSDHTYGLMVAEPDHSAAFPVRVTLTYVQQETPSSGFAGAPGTGTPDTGAEPGGETTETDVGGSDAGDDGSTSGDDGPSTTPVAQERNKGFSFLPPERSVNTPETLAPPFPFRSLLLAYLFLLPMNFVVQVYAGSIIRERLGRTGEALLASPATAWEIIIGKTAPYLVLMVLISAIIGVAIGAGWMTIVAVLPLILVFLALEFVAALYARSFRELTFLTVFASVLLTMYAFLPAAFTEVHPVALVSPIALVVMDLRDSVVTVPEFLYATLPLTLVSIVLFYLGKALYTEEDLFHQKRVFSKMVDSIARQIHGLGSGFRLSLLFIPFAFVAELMLVAFLFASPFQTGFVGIILMVALVEETVKGLPSYAAASRSLVKPHRLIAFGALVGLGYFVAEKAFLLATAAGLYDIADGSAVFGQTGAAISGTEVDWWLVTALLAAPLMLHVVTAVITALGARHGKRAFGAAFLIAVFVHVVYNLSAIRIFGGGI